jgi:ABC-type Fe3+ transport system substrate-binding protein
MTHIRQYRPVAIFLGGMAAFAATIGPSLGTEMPPAARVIIEKFHLTPDVLAGWEDEQKVPDAWLAGAKKEKLFRINGSWAREDFLEIIKPFRERYPFIEVNYSQGSTHARARVPLLAYRQGRYVTDVATGIDSSLVEYRQADALADLSDLPNLKNIPEGMGSPDAKWVAFRMRYFGLAYSPKHVTKAEMPQKWEDIITAKSLQDGKLALWDGVTSWSLPLWDVKGPEWTKAFINDLFNKVKPQQRKEGARALVALIGAGEFNAGLSFAAYQVKLEADKGAPVAFHALDIVPVTVSIAGVLKNAPNLNATKIFMNWLLSKEGQLSQFAADGNPPIHKVLQEKGFRAYPEEIAGKKIAFRHPELLDDDLKAVDAAFKPYLK